MIAALTPAAGATPDLAAIAERLAARVAKFKQPKEWHIVDELPRNAMGKVRKDELRRTYG